MKATNKLKIKKMNYYFKFLILLIILTINTSCMNKKNRDECYHIIYVEKFWFNTYGGEMILDEEEVYYLGKLCIINNDIFYKKVISKETKNYEGIEFFVKDVKEKPNSWKKFYEYKNKGKLKDYIKKEHSDLPYKIIQPSTGEKYYKNGWSKSRGTELLNAVIDYNKKERDKWVERNRRDRLKK